jgi:hypothetical protein
MMTGILFTLCILAAVGVFFYQLWRRFQLLRSAVPVSRFDRIPERIRAVLVYAFGQRKFVRRNPGAERSAGWMHFFIFWGFLILGIQIITMFGRAYSDSFVFPGFSLNLLGGPYMLLRDLMEVAVLFSVGVGLVRWRITRAPRLAGEQCSLVDAQPRHSRFFGLTAALETLPHYHCNPEHLFRETRAQGAALQAGPRK